MIRDIDCADTAISQRGCRQGARLKTNVKPRRHEGRENKRRENNIFFRFCFNNYEESKMRAKGMCEDSIVAVRWRVVMGS